MAEKCKTEIIKTSSVVVDAQHCQNNVSNNYIASESKDQFPKSYKTGYLKKTFRNVATKISDISKTNNKHKSSNYIKIEECLKQISFKNFSAEWEENILNLISKKHRERYSILINSMLNEVKELYVKDMKHFGFKMTFSRIYEDDLTSKKYLTETTNKYIEIKKHVNHFSFVEHKNLLKKIYFLSHKIIRNIIEVAESELPTIICDFKHYHLLGIMTLNSFQALVYKDIKKGAFIITNQFYTKVSEILSCSDIIANIPTKQLPRFMQCVTNVFVQQILNVMINSINHIIHIMEDESYCPQLELQLSCKDNQITIKPNIIEIFSTYHNIVTSIENIAQNLIPLEKWLKIKSKSECIEIKLPKWFIHKSHNDLELIMNKLFQPIDNHLSYITNEFGAICTSDFKTKLLELTLDESNFNLYMKHIQKYNSYLMKANTMTTNIYYSIGKLNQNAAKEFFKNSSLAIINTLTERMIIFHQEFNRSICLEFDNIKSRALNVPNNAKLLIELTEYISQTLNISMKELEQKIQKSINMLCTLLEITILTGEHINLNKETINWLELIKPVFNQNNTLCEAMKSTLEDDLQKRINILNNEIDEVFPQLVILDDMDDISKIREYIEYYRDLIKKVNQIDKQVDTINTEERLFRFPETLFPTATELKEIVVPFHFLIYIIYQWQRDKAVWLDGPFEYLNATVIEQKTLAYFEQITEASKTFKSRIKTDVTANKSYKFSGIADDPDPMQQPAPLKLCWQVFNDINEFKTYLPLIICMCNPALEKRHWKEMSTICGFNLTPNSGTTLRKIIGFNLMEKIKEYQVISIGANKELALQQELIKMIAEWNTLSFKMMYDVKSNTIIFEKLEEIEVLFGEHFVKIEEMKASYFIKPIISIVNDFFQSLTKVQDIINKWNYLQVQKIGLDPVFSYPMMELRLPEETVLYLEAKESLIFVQTKISESQNFQGIIESSELLENLHKATEKLEKSRKGVNDYLENIRLRFTRFFFVSNREIQEILFESNEIQKLLISLKSCFPGIETLKINKEKCIQSVCGIHKEELCLNKNISFSNNHKSEEGWLIQLEKEIKNAVHGNINQSHLCVNETFTYDEIKNFLSMTIACTLRMFWTSEVQKCLISSNLSLLRCLHDKYLTLLMSLTNELKNHLTRKDRNILMSIIIIVVNHEEIIKLLIDKNIIQETEFEWIAQMRFYWQDNNVEVSMFNTTVKYGYEYSYYEQSIVNTPLSDRCFRVVIEAYRYHLYAAITGLTATGKTETIKSLAKHLAIQFQMFNCNENVTYDFILQVLKGFVSCGTWICFENFDKLESTMLSAIAQKFINISQTISANLKTIMFEGSVLNLNLSGHICIILNSIQSEFSNLPDNLRILFRTVTMLIPDFKKIIEVELYAAGFSNSNILATKLHTIYTLLSKQLLNTLHYNFATWSVKTIIKIAVNLKANFPHEEESILILRSLIDVHIPRLCDADIITFQNVIRDVFPDVSLFPPDYTIFLDAFEKICAERCLNIHEIFKLKIIQLFELTHVNHAIMLIGDPFGGKTEILHTLAEISTRIRNRDHNTNHTIKLETIVPGVVTNEELFGYFNENLEIWKDGICTKIFRYFAQDNSYNKKWLVFDGPLNSIWIENLYTVLDQHKTLYLSFGEKIKMTESMLVIFETMDLLHISPAILSRCGLVYFDSNSIDWRPYALSHIKKQNLYKGHEKVLYTIFDWSIDPCINFFYEQCISNISIKRIHLVMSVLNLFEMYMKDACIQNSEDKVDHFILWSQAALIMSIIWGFGANLNYDSQYKFNAFCISLWSDSNKEYPKPETIKHFEIILPNEGLIQDNFYIFKGIGNWKHWNDLLKNEKISDAFRFNQIFIPTISTMKYSHLLLKHIKYHKPFLLNGNVSVGKSHFMQHLLTNKLSEQDFLINYFNFVSLDAIKDVKQLLLSKLNKLRKKHYSPSQNQFCINFIDDLNINSKESSKMQCILELVRQYFTYGYCYDTNNLEKIFVENVMFLCSITTRNNEKNICPRFLRHFNVYTINPPVTDDLFRIFSNVLFANLKRNLFAADVLAIVNSITNATIDIYKSVILMLRPTPIKIQYCFSIWDISKVISGCCLIQKESVETKITFIRLWVHEIWRIFGDRILDDSDKEWLFLKVRETVKSHFKDSFETAFDYLPKYENTQITKTSFKNLMFGNFMDTDKVSKVKRYEEINNMESLKNKILYYLNEYNNHFKKKIDIVISHHTLEHLIRICRILAIPGGNLLIISTVGSGKRSLTRLSSYIQHPNSYGSNIHSCYDINDWRNKLKTILRNCGTEEKDCTFYFDDRQMDNNIICDINSLMNNGEIPNLFSAEEKQNIIEMVRLRAQDGDRNAEISTHTVMNYFTEQCKNRLHFVLHFNLINNTIRTYLQSYPNLIKHCTITWYGTWPEEALVQIAFKYLENVNIQENVKENIIKSCIKFHSDADEMSTIYYQDVGRKTYITSALYLHMINLYSHLIMQKQEEIIVMRNRYLTGLEKLELAAKQVEQMRNTLTILKPQLELSAQQTEATMKEVETENVIVERATILVKQEEEIANKKTEIAGALKAECEADLAVAIPILEDAVSALNTLKPTDITLVKAMKNPPDTVKLVMAAVCVMLNVPPDRTIDPVTGKKFTDYWGPSKRVLGDMNFLQNLKEYDKDNIPLAVMQIIKKTYMTDNSFMPHIVAKASSAAEGLCKWVRAMVSYDEVAKVVAPKKEKLMAAQKECDEAEALLNEKRQTLSVLNAKLATLNSNLQDTLQKKLMLENEVKICTIKLQKAETLIASLGGEKDHWMQRARILQLNYDNLVGDMILSCGIIVYMASYNITFRDKILNNWIEYIHTLKIPYSKPYNFVNVLGTETEINLWYLSGLFKDRLSTENAIIMRNSKQWCLFIDFQNQTNSWIKKIEKKNDLVVLKLTNTDYMTAIKNSIEYGKPVLLENVKEKIDIRLDAILSKDIYKDGETWYLNIDGDIIKYSHKFRFYITTNLFNPSYLPDVFNRLTVIDFSIPNKAVQDKLLDTVISKERPELQEKFEDLLMQDAANKKVLQQQEDNILITLSSTTTNILEDENAMQILNSSKNLASDIKRRQETARLTIEEINKFRNTYVQFAKHSAGLFSTLNALSNLDHMYRFSLSWFIQLYIRSIETSNRSIVPKKRLQFLKSSFIQNLYLSVCRSLFDKHKLLYSFLLCCRILIDTQQTTEEEVKFFINTNIKYTNIIPNSKFHSVWSSIKTGEDIHKTNYSLPIVNELISNIHSNHEAWKEYCDAEFLQNDLIPEPWKNKLTSFQKLILVKIIRPDKVITEIMQLIENNMGHIYNVSPQLKISQSYAESTCLTPLIFILPSYSSPLSLISTYACAMGYSSKLSLLSMGEKQETTAEYLIQQAQRDGGWVFLQNCHLATTWMTKLENICENCDVSSISLDFRLWLSSLSTDQFPISILHNSIKITNDCPLNFKQNLLKLYESEPLRNKAFFEGCAGKDKIFSKLLYGVCFFHVIVKERNHFGAQSWRIPYEFDYSDFLLSITQLQNLINETDDVPFKTILYFIGECNYGGKVVDEFDNKCLKYLLNSYCNVDMIKNSRYAFFNTRQHFVPQRCEYHNIMKHIKDMPLDLSPEIFGSNRNAIIIKDTSTAMEFLKSMSMINQVNVPPNEQFIHDEVLSMTNDIINNLPNLLNLDEIYQKYPPVFLQPLNTVLIHETKSINNSLKIIKKSLSDLKSAFSGYIILTDALEDLSQEIYHNKMPQLWKETHNDVTTNKLSNYISTLLKRVKFIEDWINSGSPHIIPFDILSSCKTFLSASFLMFSRQQSIPIEQVSFSFEVTNEVPRYIKDDNIYFICGLHLSGALWNSEKQILTESQLNTFWQDMPPIQLTFNRHKKLENNVYKCPLYVSPIQINAENATANVIYINNYITNIPLRTNVSYQHWIKLGVALFCKTD